MFSRASRQSMPIASRVSATDVRFRPAVELVVVVPSRMVLWGIRGQEESVVVRLFEGDVVSSSLKSRCGCNNHVGTVRKVPTCCGRFY